jgi:hypothetical protein
MCPWTDTNNSPVDFCSAGTIYKYRRAPQRKDPSDQADYLRRLDGVRHRLQFGEDCSSPSLLRQHSHEASATGLQTVDSAKALATFATP